MSELESRLAALEERNRRVEAQKAWEGSWLRRGLIVAITYIVACSLTYWLGAPDWPMASLMPVFGYLLSTLTIPQVRAWWIERRLA